MVDIRAARGEFYASKVVTRGHFQHVEMRDEGAGRISFRGFASVTDVPYAVWDWLGEYEETICRGAFTKSLREQDDVRFLVNHDGVPMARTKSGTLTLSEISKPEDDPQGRGQTGLWVEAPDLDASNPTVQEIRSAMLRGDISEMSFGFIATRQEWNEDYTERRVLELRLLDVSIVTYPANPATSAELSDDRSVVREAALRALDAGRVLTSEQRAFFREAVEQRDALVSINVTITETETELEHEEPDGDEVEVESDRSAALAAARLASARVDSSMH